MKSRAVIVIGPPWVRSGTARVMQNQIEYYRQRGYLTVFLGVAVDSLHVRTCWVWDVFAQGAHELGAEHVSSAVLEPQRRRDRYASQIGWLLRHRLRGTALNGIVDVAATAKLPDEFARFLDDLSVELIHVNHVYTLGFAQRLRRRLSRNGHQPPMIVDTHDVQSHLLQERGALNPWTHRPDKLDDLIRSEKGVLGQANVLVHCSADDFNFFKALLPDKQHVLTLPVIDQDFISAVNLAAPLDSKIDLLFVGAGHAANLAALKWFFEVVWPRIADREYNFTIVGDIDALMRRDLPQLYEAFRSCFVGRAADLAPYYRAARCVIAPMVSGTGISVKTIEALALGKPFIGTSKAFRGLPAGWVERAGLRVHDDPQEFADAIACALATERSAGALSRAAYEKLFSVQAAFASMDEAVRMAKDCK